MNDITEMCAVMLAAENGAKIEILNGHEWQEITDPVWNWGISEYRVAEFPQEQDDE